MTPEEVHQVIIKRAGWLAPNNNLYPCGNWQHLEGIANVVPHFRELLEDQKTEFAEQDRDWIDNIPEGEHPEWHWVEMSQDDARSTLHDRIIKEAYQLGYVRIGVIYSDAIVHVEGLSQCIKKSMKEIEEICEACSVHHCDRYTIQRSDYK